MTREICPCCGKEKDATVAFGMMKTELSNLFRNTVGPGGYQERKRTGRTGYELFALALEKKEAENKKAADKSKVVVSFRRTNTKSSDNELEKISNIAEDIYDFIKHEVKKTNPINTTKYTFRKVGKINGRECEQAVNLLKKQGRIKYIKNNGSANTPPWNGWVPINKVNKWNFQNNKKKPE